MTFDELLIPANEKLETNILDKTLKRKMTLYHGTQYDNLSVISPTSINVGTRLSPIYRKSSFWTNNFDYAVIWALDFVAMRYNMQYFHDIERKKFVVPPLRVMRKGDNKEYWAEEWMLESLKTRPVYVYEADIPTRYIGRGQYAIDEYTVDIDVTPKRKIVITPEIAEKYIMYCQYSKDFDKEYTRCRGVFQKEKVSFMEKVIFKNVEKVKKKRTKLYLKENGDDSMESVIRLCNNLTIENK